MKTNSHPHKARLRNILLASALAALVGLPLTATAAGKTTTTTTTKKAPAPTPDKGGGGTGGTGGGDKGGGGTGGGGKGNAITIGARGASTPAKYYFSGNVSLPRSLVVDGPVVIVADGDFNIGTNRVTIAPGGSLTLFVKGDLTASGNGHFNNNNVPASLLVLGTADAHDRQEITLNGNGLLSAVTYAPFADINSNGGGSGGALLGSMVAMNIRFNGNPGPFHFDEALADLRIFGGYEVDDYRSFRIGEKIPSMTAQTALQTRMGSYDSLFASVFGE